MDELSLLKDNLEKELIIEIPGRLDFEQLFGYISALVNKMADSDFPALVNLLYKIDVSESRLQKLLASEKSGNVGDIIAGLIIERQLLKIKTKLEYRQKDKKADDDEERW